MYYVAVPNKVIGQLWVTVLFTRQGQFLLTFGNCSFWALASSIEIVSGYVCNHGSPSGERDTASPRGRYGERLQRDSCLKNTYVKTPSVGRRQPMTSLPVLP